MIFSFSHTDTSRILFNSQPASQSGVSQPDRLLRRMSFAVFIISAVSFQIAAFIFATAPAQVFPG